ncbi:hypothetical protein L0P96_01180 [Anoxybacillus flavithermus]|uniref:hypothetical protein n=1 Tax=Anoxybacillus TaxID=150247 RepID=UPI0013012515|nr:MULTISPECIES: hypothetical protein [Anoxybacillus]
MKMGRGVHFHHKKKGHESEKPKHGESAPSKQREVVDYAIDTVGNGEHRPVTIERVKE